MVRAVKGALLALLVPLALLQAPPAVALGPDPSADRQPWALMFHGGMQVNFLEPTPFGEQVAAAGYFFAPIGPSFGVSLQRYVLNWLIVGGTLDARYFSGGRSDSAILSHRDASSSMGLWRVGGGAYLQPTVCVADGRCVRGGMSLGLQLGVATGPTFWTYRGGTDVGAHLRLVGAFVWEWSFDATLIGIRVVHEGIWQTGMGPRSLGHGASWYPGVDLRVGFRW